MTAKQRRKKSLAKFHALSSTKRIVKTARRSDSLLKVNRWGILLTNMPKEGFEFMLEECLLPILQEKIESLKDVIDLTAKTLKMRDFRRICKARGIVVYREERPGESGTLLGQYRVVPNSDIQSIWIKPTLTPRQALFVAAHELSHYLLHREGMLNGDISKSAYKFSDAPKKKKNRKSAYATWTEIEADLLASMMLTKGINTEVQNA